jgi:hypothetical protein
MSDQAYTQRYRTFSPDAVAAGIDVAAAEAESAEAKKPGGPDEVHHFLTWTILSICLALWAAIGFLLWLPLVFRAMANFSFALAASMLNGERPVKAGENLREAVSFYRRGFSVAVDAVFHDAKKARNEGAGVRRRPRMSPRDFVFEVLWATVFWYVLLYFLGGVTVSPLDGWIALIELRPWATLVGWVSEGMIGL